MDRDYYLFLYILGIALRSHLEGQRDGKIGGELVVSVDNQSPNLPIDFSNWESYIIECACL
jgi:hypothetical protein